MKKCVAYQNAYLQSDTSCAYRTAFSWARQSRLLRRTAWRLLCEDAEISGPALEAWNRLYCRAADESLRRAITFSLKFAEYGNSKIINYNISCYWSMKVLFLLESYLPVSGTPQWRQRLPAYSPMMLLEQTDVIVGVNPTASVPLVSDNSRVQ